MRSYLRSMSASNRSSGVAGQVSQPFSAISRFQLAGAPAGIAERHQRAARAAAGRDGAQDVDRGGQADVVGDGQRGFHPVVVRMQHEAAAAVDRSAIAHDEIAGLRRQPDRLLLVHDAELHQKIGKQHLLRLVDDQAHRAFVAVRADVDDRAREPVVLHAGHGNQELVVEKAASAGRLLVAQQVHGRERNAFPERRKDAPRAIRPKPNAWSNGFLDSNPPRRND